MRFGGDPSGALAPTALSLCIRISLLSRSLPFANCSKLYSTGGHLSMDLVKKFYCSKEAVKESGKPAARRRPVRSLAEFRRVSGEINDELFFGATCARQKTLLAPQTCARRACAVAGCNSLNQVIYHLVERVSSSAIHSALTASEGIAQSPRGDRVTEPTLGPSGRQERLNCWVKKRR